MAKEVVIYLNIQYEDGRKETKQMTFEDNLIYVEPYYNENYLSEYIVKKESTEESISEAVTD